MKAKRLFLGASLVLLGFAAASCSGSKTVRNTVTPYGSLNNKLDTVIATANNDKYSLNLDTYYTRLKYKGYSTFTTALNKLIYADYLKAVTTLYNNKTLASITDADEKENFLKAYTLIDNDIALFEIDEAKYTELRRDLLTSINKQVQSKILSNSSADTILKKTEKEINTLIAKFVDSQARAGYTINASDIKWITKDNSNYELSKYSDLLQFSYETLDKIPNIINDLLLTEAQYQACKIELYKIADEEYIYNEESEDDVKNSNYLFKEDSIESGYDKSYKTFGTYNAIVIQFNSRREALNTIEAIGDISTQDTNAALETYLDIYESYYSYKVTNSSATDPEFFYTIDDEHDDFDDLTDSIATLIKDTLEIGEYLTEPRNINNKYVLAYKIGVEYDYHKDGDTSKQLDYNDLSDAQKKDMEVTIKENLINANYSSYKTTLQNKLIEDAELKIYDPYFEYKFEYSNTDYYTPIEEKVDATSNVLFDSKYGSYTVEEFYKEASTTYASSIISDYFQLEYAYEYIDKFIEEEIIDKDSKETNEENLNSAIETFKNDKNSTYPKEIGLETYFIACYGYKTKDDVLKYHYSATNALAQYKNKVLYDEWAKEITTENDTISYVISDEATTGFLKNILATGNNNYSELFSINLDHILINIDDNADGNPDDPQDFLSKNPTVQAEFEAAVEKLAKAIYLESINPAYKDNTLYETLKFIKTQYEEGAELRSNPGHNWDEYKTFNFLLTVEQLASSSDINQSSVNNFVVPFKEYVENVYKTAVANNVDKEFDNGTFYFVSKDANNDIVGNVAKTESDSSLVTFDSLCATNYGYHMLVLNSYDSPKSTKFTEDNDSSESQKELQIVIRTYKNDKDDEDDDVNVYVVTDSYNTETNQASFNQFFIYYVQSANGVSSVLDSDISELLSSMFSDSITTYKSTNFQTFLLLDLLNVEIKDVEIGGYKVNTNAVNAEKTYYANQVISYDADSDYVSWINGSLDWTRPDQIK